MYGRNCFDIEITIRPKYNTFDDEFKKDPFNGDLGKQYKKEALVKIAPFIAEGIERGKVDLTTLKDAFDSIYTYGKDMEITAYWRIK